MYSPKANKQQQKEIVPSVFLYGSCYIPVLSLPSTSKLNFSLAISFSLSFRIRAWAPSRLKKRLLKIACHPKRENTAGQAQFPQEGRGGSHLGCQLIPTSKQSLNLLGKTQTSNCPRQEVKWFLFLPAFFLPPWEKWLKDFYLALQRTNLGPTEKKHCSVVSNDENISRMFQRINHGPRALGNIVGATVWRKWVFLWRKQSRAYFWLS